MKHILLLYKSGETKKLVTSDDLYNKMKNDYSKDNYLKNEQAYIFFSEDEFNDEMIKAEANKLF